MLRHKQHSRRDPPPCRPAHGAVESDLRVEVLADLLDSLDLRSFLLDPLYRRRLNDALASFSDEEFDSFEQLYTRKTTVN